MTAARQRVEGFSMVELMIASVIGLMLMAVIGSAFVASRQVQRTADGIARLQETARSASLFLESSLRIAGYLPSPAMQTDPTGIFVSPRRAVFGGDAAAPAYSGIANALTTSDYIALSFVGNDDRTLHTCLGDIVTGTQIAFMVFFVSRAAGDEVASLSCATEIRTLGTKGAVTLTRNEPIQTGVVDFQVVYSLDTDADLLADRYAPAADIPKISTGEANAANNWNHVTGVELTVTVQSPETVERGVADNGLVQAGRLNRSVHQFIALRNRLLP